MLGALIVPAAAEAQILRVSPGPLSDSHAKWDSVGDCFRCHAKDGKTLVCYGCHQHETLKKDVDAGVGLHVKLRQPCKDCHPEHKGRDHKVADWSKLGGKNNFAHKRTGFPLTGMHAKVKCEKCHETTTPKGRTSYVGLRPRCAGCHEDPHKFSEKRFKEDCKLCHVVGGKGPKDMRGKDVPFDHAADAGTPLVGRHANLRCNECHKDKAMSIARGRRTCKGCHEDKHGRLYDKFACDDCHHPSRRYEDVRFNHARTQFKLAGKHARASCKDCHASSQQKPNSVCSTCHKDKHQERFKAFDCSQCHRNASWKPVGFRHARLAKFALIGGHRKTQCRDCHRGKGPTNFERQKSDGCQDCHKHENAHDGQFQDRPCTDCHIEGGKDKLRFDHNKNARFPLLGFHEPLQGKGGCRKCHTRGNYRTGKLKCIDCHKDSHGGELGSECERCHSAKVKFAEIKFDHGSKSKFEVEGLHVKLECVECHPKNNEGRAVYRTKKTNCIDCHEKDDPHRGKLGRDCERCHRAEKGAPKFAHNGMTEFALTGQHLAVACWACHRDRPAQGPPRLGAIRAMKPMALDQQFPIMGRVCNECHADQHDGRYGRDCASCHTTLGFDAVSAAVHDTGSFRLQGVHNRLPCERCHTPKRLLKGIGNQCQNCHRDDDGHRNALGPFCGDCHRQVDWRQTKFSHIQTGFPLRGAHRMASCDGCHGVGRYQGIPTGCDTCHLRDAQAVSDPIHTAELQPCDRCHREIGFVPARIDHPEFRLSGQHRLLRCKNCHSAGAYAGTPSNCESCHSTLYFDPKTEPNHRAEGYPLSCEDCHSPMGWRPATNR